MICDNLLLFSTAQVLTGITDTSAVSTDSADLSVARDIGEGEPLFGHFNITTGVTNGTSTEFEIISATDAALTSGIISLGTTGPIATADLTQYKSLSCALRPLIGLTGARYIGARYTVVGTNLAGAVTARIVSDIQDGKKFYASWIDMTP
jgi:hypothetical protein